VTLVVAKGQRGIPSAIVAGSLLPQAAIFAAFHSDVDSLVGFPAKLHCGVGDSEFTVIASHQAPP